MIRSPLAFFVGLSLLVLGLALIFGLPWGTPAEKLGFDTTAGGLILLGVGLLYDPNGPDWGAGTRRP